MKRQPVRQPIQKKNTTTSNTCARCGDLYPRMPGSGLGTTLCPKCDTAFFKESDLLYDFYHPPLKAVEGIKLLLEGLAEAYPKLDLEIDHFKQTPQRVARMFVELCWGLSIENDAHLNTAFEESDYGGIVFIGNIGFTSLCMHHFAIFRGIAHVGYIPDGRIVGLSKINRTVELLAARPQVQEQLTFQIANTIDKTLKPKGVAVVLEGTHDCIEVRGVRSKGSITKTSEMRGVFLSNSKDCKEEFFSLIEKEKK